MARTSSGTSEPDAAVVRALNDHMVSQLLQEPPGPLVERGYALRVLETRGRVSGLARRAPIGVLQSAGQWWLVSPQGTRDWVRNLRADPRCALLAGDERMPRRAVEGSVEQLATVVPEYLAVVTVPWAREAFPVSPESPQAVVFERASAMAVFRLDPGDDIATVSGRRCS